MRLIIGLSRMRRESHVRFLGEAGAVTPRPYPTQIRRGSRHAGGERVTLNTNRSGAGYQALFFPGLPDRLLGYFLNRFPCRDLGLSGGLGRGALFDGFSCARRCSGLHPLHQHPRQPFPSRRPPFTLVACGNVAVVIKSTHAFPERAPGSDLPQKMQFQRYRRGYPRDGAVPRFRQSLCAMRGELACAAISGAHRPA